MGVPEHSRGERCEQTGQLRSGGLAAVGRGQSGQASLRIQGLAHEDGSALCSARELSVCKGPGMDVGREQG